MYHISDYKKYIRCPFLYAYEKQKEKTVFNPFVRIDDEVSLLAAERLGISSYFLGKRGDEPSVALEAVKEHEWLVKARFEYHDLRVKVPFLHKVDGGWEVYFLFVGLYPHNDDSTFYALTIWVLEHNGIHVKDMKILHLNADYVREEELDVKQLFVLTDCFYNKNNHPSIRIADAVKKYSLDPDVVLQEMKASEGRSPGVPERTSKCSSHKKCLYFDACFPENEKLPCNSILTLSSSQNKYAMYQEGKLYLKDADTDRIEGSRMQYAEIMADKNNGFFADRLALKSWLDRVHYPVTFLDFEWERFAIPPYPGMKPYDVLPFEYSIHVLKEDGAMTHSVFLSIHDDREALIQGLLKDTCTSGTVVAYNAEGAEKIRLMEMAEQFPQYASQLMNIYERMEDLQIPFITGAVYDTRMEGQWSLKKIMAMMNDKSYLDLDINKGMDAVFQWRHLDNEENIENKQEIIENLKKYCGMDTYAMTVVYAWLKKIVE